MKFLYNKVPQVEFNNIHVLIISGMSTDEEEFVKVKGCGAISENDGDANNVYIFWFIFFPYTPQEDVGLDGNQLAYCDLV